MAEFNNTNLADFSGVWVFCEQRQGKLQPTVLELMSEGRKLADDMGVELCGLLLGKDVDGMAKELGAYGADKVYIADSPLLETYTTDAYAKVICDTVMEKKPEIMLIAATNIGRDLGPRCAAPAHGPDRRLHASGRRCGEVRGVPEGSVDAAGGADRRAGPL